MNKTERMMLLIDYGRDVALQMAQNIIDNHRYEMLVAPHEALTMIKVRESAENSLFYLGEVLITECRIRIDGVVGVGIIKGMEPELAQALALIDGAYRSGLAQRYLWDDLLVQVKQRQIEMIKQETNELALTKVDFSAMNQ